MANPALTNTATFPTLTEFQAASPQEQRDGLAAHIPHIANRIGQLQTHITQVINGINQTESPAAAQLLATHQQNAQLLATHRQTLNHISAPIHLQDGHLVGTFTTVHGIHQDYATIAQNYLDHHPDDDDHESEASNTSSMINNPATSSASSGSDSENSV